MRSGEDKKPGERDDDAPAATFEGRKAATSSGPPPAGPGVSAASLEIGDVIAESSMGVVRAAVQKSLGRAVVIKTTPRRSAGDDAKRMLREAWVTGYLEHPGVVPVYDIAVGEDGAPIVVMRRIRGKTWHSTMRDPTWAAVEGVRDLLEQNLRVLVRVCEIVEFAHSKSVVHRDLKPSNVMVGTFGEVYLLDWGLAVATGGAPAKHLPLAAEAREACGTLSYAAPEMVGLIDAPISPRTDVYLLGSVLFELATGQPPHRAGEARDIVASIDTTPPAMPASMSPQLGAICTRALQKDPADRHASAGEVRRDILAFLRQRDSEHVAIEGERALGRLKEACAGDGSRQRIHDLYGECRFACQEALRTWPENEAARAGLAEAARVVIEHELGRDPRGAAALLAEAPCPLPDLEKRIAEAMAAEESERAKIAKVARDHDANVGRRVRRIFLIGMGLAWSLGQLADRVAPITYERFLIGSVVQLPIVALAWALSPELRSTTFNRRMLAAVGVHVCSQIGLFLAGMALGVDIALIRLLQVGLWAVIATLLAVVFERRFWPMAVAMVAAFVVVTLAPHLRPVATTVAIAILTFNAAAIRAPKE